ncbi:glycosyltransferase [Massilia endophytica]|uniref:glycosyltransferase n=1 Tax=Massilia endophytica TaxID=2899220 RepID=UPI001E3F3A3F|nr:glycosyltransferase [Massilia endophytica]UGQ46226.1 glycosyltransferase [Massilia endophytica]
MVKRVLMVAFHFPPLHGSSGIQRTLKFAKYLPQHGWQPLVLSAHPRAYPQTGPDQMEELDAHIVVRRAFALDASRHLSLFGRYPGWLAQPDRWASWVAGAIPAGLSLIRHYKPQLIWSTYPIASANLIGYALHRLSGLPWIADFRDPMIDEHYPANALSRRMHRRMEQLTMQRCAAAVCTTAAAARSYRRSYPGMDLRLIENGYDEADFMGVEPTAPACDRPFTMLHSGVIYPSERDPGPLLQAIGSLLREGILSPLRFRLVLRATGHDAHLRELIAGHGVETVVQTAPHIGYREALAEMLSADGLLLLQAANCNEQVPAKLYEYLRARRPLLALTDQHGETAAVLRQAGVDTIAPLDSAEEIRQALPRFIELASSGKAPMASDAAVAKASRLSRTAELAALMDEIIAGEREGAAARTRERSSPHRPLPPG